MTALAPFPRMDTSEMNGRRAEAIALHMRLQMRPNATRRVPARDAAVFSSASPMLLETFVAHHALDTMVEATALAREELDMPRLADTRVTIALTLFAVMAAMLGANLVAHSQAIAAVAGMTGAAACFVAISAKRKSLEHGR